MVCTYIPSHVPSAFDGSFGCLHKEVLRLLLLFRQIRQELTLLKVDWSNQRTTISRKQLGIFLTDHARVGVLLFMLRHPELALLLVNLEFLPVLL